MEAKSNLVEPLLEKAEAYCITSFELLRLKALDKTAEAASGLASRTLLTIAIAFFVLILNIGIALWIGDLLGKNYYGFLIVAAFYGLVAIVLMAIHPHIKGRVGNAIIKQFV